MKIIVITDKYSVSKIKQSFSQFSGKQDLKESKEINYILNDNEIQPISDNCLLVIEDEHSDFLEIISAAISSELFEEIVICETKTNAESFLNHIKTPPIMCTLDFQLGSVNDIYEDVGPLYKKIKSKFTQTIVIGYTQFENSSSETMGDQAGKLVELFRTNLDSVYNKYGMSGATLINIFRDKIKTQLLKYQKEIKLLSEKINQLGGFDEIIGNSLAIKSILKIVERVAKTDARILITGENGTGKELIAQAIHKQSERANIELIEVNCAAIHHELIESELFGHEKGSFTGAVKQHIGKFEQADGGNLFLDEIGDMSLQVQAKVLRAIEEGKIERVGGNSKIDVNVRIISATNKDLLKEIEKKNFREDLYHRLNVIPINIPPLRERKEDIPALVEHFSKIICDKNKFQQKHYSDVAIKTLQSLPWKGNVRELRNAVERIIILSSQQEITNDDVKSLVQNSIHPQIEDLLSSSSNFMDITEKFQKFFLTKHLLANNCNISNTAQSIGMNVRSLHSLLSKLNIDMTKYNNAIEASFIETLDEDSDPLDTKGFLFKIENILVEHYQAKTTVKENEIAEKFISTIKGQSGITREQFSNKELGPRKKYIKQLLTANPDKWPNCRMKCRFIKNLETKVK